MRPFLLALVCLSILAAAQNVLALSPVEPFRMGHVQTSRGEGYAPAFTVGEFDRAAPELGTMGLLFAGLAGLTAAGSRARRPRRESD